MLKIMKPIDFVIKVVSKYGEMGAGMPSYHGMHEKRVPEELVKHLKDK